MNAKICEYIFLNLYQEWVLEEKKRTTLTNCITVERTRQIVQIFYFTEN